MIDEGILNNLKLLSKGTWKITDIGDYSFAMSLIPTTHSNIDILLTPALLLPLKGEKAGCNPDYVEIIITKEVAVVYLKNKVPNWIEIGDIVLCRKNESLAYYFAYGIVELI